MSRVTGKDMWICLIVIIFGLFTECAKTYTCLVDDLPDECTCEGVSIHKGIREELRDISCTRLQGRTGFEQVLHALNFENTRVNIKVVTFHVSFSSLTELTDDDFNNMPDLKLLNLTHNHLSSISSKTFDSLSKLESLDLSYNNLTEISEKTLEKITNVVNLSLANNKITNVVFPDLTSLEQLDISNNHLPYIGEDAFTNLTNLLSLSLASNELKQIHSEAFKSLHSLEFLDLSNNGLQNLSADFFMQLDNLQKLSLINNSLTSLTENVFKENKKLTSLDLGGNPWCCDNKLYWVYEWMKSGKSIPFHGKEKCHSPPDFENQAVMQALEAIFLEKKIQECSTCKLCNCTVDKQKVVTLVHCKDKNLKKLPSRLPYNTRVVNLENNQISLLTRDHIEPEDWENVKYLYLDNNAIETLKGMEGTNLLKNLVDLRLTKNRLSDIPIYLLEQFTDMLDQLYLADNPWKCDCNTVRFQTWLQDHYKKVRDIEGIRCSADSGSNANQAIYRLMKSDLCPQHVQLINYLDILNSVISILIVLIVMKLLYDYWQQKRTGKLPTFFSFKLR